MTSHTHTECAEERVDAWGTGPLTMPDGLDAEQWIAWSEDLDAVEVLGPAQVDETRDAEGHPGGDDDYA